MEECGDDASETSELTRLASFGCEALYNEEASSTDTVTNECTATVCIDGKHPLRIRESFFNEMCVSTESLKRSSAMESIRRKPRERWTISDEFKVLQNGFWKRVTFDEDGSRFCTKDDSHYLWDQWIQRLGPVSKKRPSATSDPRSCSVTQRRTDVPIGKRRFTLDHSFGSGGSRKINRLNRTRGRQLS